MFVDQTMEHNSFLWSLLSSSSWSFTIIRNHVIIEYEEMKEKPTINRGGAPNERLEWLYLKKETFG